jgi:hypothetical protein
MDAFTISLSTQNSSYILQSDSTLIDTFASDDGDDDNAEILKSIRFKSLIPKASIIALYIASTGPSQFDSAVTTSQS